MLASAISTVILGASLCLATPLNPRAVTLDPAATAEAQPRDDTATRAFSAVPIKANNGQCLQVTSGSGDFRNNLTPVEVKACDNSKGQLWDVITSGKHNNQQDAALIVSTLTNACLNFDPRRPAGNQVLLFSCGGRADGGGQVSDSQLFNFTGCAGPVPLVPKSNKDAPVCLTVKGGVLDQAACNPAQASQDQLFTFGNPDGSAAPAAAASSPSVNNAVAAPAVTPAPAAGTAATPTAPVSVSRAGGTLNPTAAAESHKRDDTATRALANVSIKTSTGQCFTVDAAAGDFRENLIPISVANCDNSAGQKFDVITAGKHNNQPGTALLVSTLTQGCVNFDARRPAGDQVLLFSCGGRADGDGGVTDSQLFPFTDGKQPQALTPKSDSGAFCLTVNNGKVDAKKCDAKTAGGTELFTFA